MANEEQLKYLRRLNYMYAIIVFIMTSVIVFALISVAMHQNDRITILEGRLLEEGRVGTLPEDRFDDLDKRIDDLIEKAEQN